MAKVLAVLGYPLLGISIQSGSQETYIKNDFCFPVVMHVNERIWALPEKTQQGLGVSQWSQWHWIPGKISVIKEKIVLNKRGA